MSAFRFPLQRILDWRRTQLEMEEIRFKQHAAAAAVLDRTRAELDAEGIRAETEVRGWSSVAGRDLAALGSFRLQVRARERDLARRRADCQKQLEAQQVRMLEARRQCRLLDRLKERRAAEWKAAEDRRQEELAAECYLAQWSVRRTL
jgi:flagellar export protein FliJ